MSKIDIKLTNKFYNNFERKKYDSFNLKMQKKKKTRLANVEKKPLTEQEKHLFAENIFTNEQIIKCDGFYKINDLSHIMYVLSSADTGTFYEETKFLSSKFPVSNMFGTSIMDEQSKKSFISSGGPNSIGLQHISEFKPQDSFLSEYVSKILIFSFGISYDFKCVDFQVFYSDKFIKQMNECLTNKFDTDIEYKETIIGGKKSVSICHPFCEIVRLQYVDDVLFEIKARVSDFLKNHYTVFDFNEAPFSIDEYRTNLSIEDRFVGCYGYMSLNQVNLLDFNYQDSENNGVRGSILFDYQSFVKHPFYNLQRGRLLFFVKDDKFVYANQAQDYMLLFFIQNNELEKYKNTLHRKYVLFEKTGKNKKIISNAFKDYAKLCLEVNNRQTLLESDKIQYLSYVSNDQKLAYLFKYIEDETNKLNSRNDKLDLKINNLLSSKNNSFSSTIAFIALAVSSLSTIVAIVTLLITVLAKRC